jgi:hypothetical protein
MFQRKPIPTLPGRPTRGGSAAVAVAPQAMSTGEQGAWFVDHGGRLYLENPMVAGLYARYESLEDYNRRKALPVYVRDIPSGTPVRINMRTLTAER